MSPYKQDFKLKTTKEYFFLFKARGRGRYRYPTNKCTKYTVGYMSKGDCPCKILKTSNLNAFNTGRKHIIFSYRYMFLLFEALGRNSVKFEKFMTKTVTYRICTGTGIS
jgi:hypothetical protein